MKPFVVNRYGRIVFPFNFFPELDFSVFQSLEQFAAVIRRDFEEKAPTETDIVARIEGARHEPVRALRDLALNLWVNRYAMTMYRKQPTRWRDVPRSRDDVFLLVFRPWDGGELVTAIETGYRALAPTWDRDGAEIFTPCWTYFRHKKGAGRSAPALCRQWRRSCEPRRTSRITSSRTIRTTRGTGTRSHRVRLAVRGARGPPAPVDGAPQPVPVGPGPERLIEVGQLQAERLRDRLPAAQHCRSCSSSGARGRGGPGRGSQRRSRPPAGDADPASRRACPVPVLQAAVRVARRVPGRARLHQRRPDPERRVVLVAHDRR